MGSMDSEKEHQVRINVESTYGGGSYLQKFRLYETRANFYMVGRDKNRTCWKVLKINRLEQSELSIVEDATTYSENECSDLLKRIHDGNKSTGGLKFVTTCYGIVGFIKFLGPYYMVLITKRRKIGSICGHAVYSIAKSEMILIPNSTIELTFSKNENRYKKLLRTMDLTRDFYFSYSYHVMLSLQKNLSNSGTGLILYETMFVWNEFLTRGIRQHLKNSVWTVALVYGFFKQVKLSISGRDFDLILIARRSRHYAGTRYLKRGVNEKGRVANDVETEQIVLEDVPDGCPMQISSVVQNRGSIPLFWSQETSKLNIKPSIILSKKDHQYEATKLHFENLVKRYGNPIIILNLIKTREKKPRESILRTEFATAIEIVNRDIEHGNRLKFLHWDLSKYSRNKAASVLAYLVKVAANALELTGFFYCQLPTSSSDCTDKDICDMLKYTNALKEKDSIKDKVDMDGDGGHFAKPPVFQKGVLRTNCIDCLDRTNVAQYVYGLVALGHQLHALGYIDASTINLDSPLADDLMKTYEAMGDTLAFQYGGSAAHNKIFSEIRGQWKAATQSQELFRTLQRYYSNAYMDAEKQDAINVFLGHFQPQQGKPALWEMDSDQHYDVGRRGSDFAAEKARSIIKRSLSDGNILCESNTDIDEADVKQMENNNKSLPVKNQGSNGGLSESTPEISTCDSGIISCSRFTPSMSSKQLFPDMQSEHHVYNDIMRVERGDSFHCSNFLDVEWLSSSGNSCEEDTYERSLLMGSPTARLSSGEIKMDPSSAYESGSSLKGKEPASAESSYISECGSDSVSGFSERFVYWVSHGEMLFP